MHAEQAELLANAFVVDIEPLKNGNFSQLYNPVVVDVDSLTFIVVQPQLEEPQRFHKVVMMRSSHTSEVNGNAHKNKILFSTKNGVLQVHRSNKKESDNEFIGLWNEHLDVVTRFMKFVLNRERRIRKKSDSIWLKQDEDVGTIRYISNIHGTRHMTLFLPRNSPPIVYQTPCGRNVQTMMHLVPNIVSPLYNASGKVDGESMLIADIMRRSIPTVACLELAKKIEITGNTLYRHREFTRSNTAIIHPEMRAIGVSAFACTPWMYWGQILEYMIDKPSCCTIMSFNLEAMDVSDWSDIGSLDVSYRGDVVRIYGNDDCDADHLTYTVSEPDGSAVNLDQYLQVVSTGSVWGNDGAVQQMGVY